MQNPDNAISICSDAQPTKQRFSHPLPVPAQSVLAQTKSQYPTSTFRGLVTGREKRKLGDHFGLTNFGVNHTTLAPGASSALPHSHSEQDEFIYILSGTAVCQLQVKEEPDDSCDATLSSTTTSGEYVLKTGDCIGFPKATGVSHCIINPSKTEPVTYLEIGDRTQNDIVTYGSGIDLRAEFRDGKYTFVHKDGSSYSFPE
jgi:uncharacterized cupin superfamily protein